MKIMKIFRNIILGIVGIIYFTFVILMTTLLLNYNDYGISVFGDLSLILINEDIANDNYKKGDLVIVETVKLEDIKEGETIFTYHVDRNGSVSVDLGEVGKVSIDDQAISFANGSTYADEFIIGNEYKVYNGIGSFLGFLTSQWGFFFAVLVPCFIVFVYQLYALIIEVKYGEEEYVF